MILKKYTITETAKIIGVTRQTLFRWIRKEVVVPRKTLGGKSFFVEEDIEKLKKANENGL